MSISTFDCLGPIMIGPSSSHTAGAAKIGLVANKIADNNIKSVIFYLHGSFAKTHKGHGYKAPQQEEAQWKLICLMD